MELDVAALRPFLDAQVTGGIDGDLEVSLLAGGRSNPTYWVADRRREWVLRRPPFGHVLPTAHDMAREHRVQRALATTPVPVPTIVATCDDPEVIGAPFYVMERVEGLALRGPEQTSSLTPAERAGLSDALVDLLVSLHEVEAEAVGLAGWGRPDGYLQRQLRRWREQWTASRRAVDPAVDELFDALERTRPASHHPGIVHGDFKIDNVLVDHDDPARIVALLDWEMATRGDTLTDVGVMLSFWDEPGEAPNPITRGATAMEGFPTRNDLAARYARRRGLELADLTWYLVFADLKIGVILEGIHARDRQGQTVGDGFEGIGDMARSLLSRGHARIDELEPVGSREARP